MQKSAAVIILSLVLFSLLALPVRADYLYDRSGTLISIDGSVLGDDALAGEAENEVEAATELELKRVEQKREQDKKKLEREIEARKKLNEKKAIKSQLEIKSEDGKFKLKQETRDKDGRITKKEVELKKGESLHVENEQGERTEIKSMVMDRIEERQENREERKEERVENREQKLEMIKDKVKARTDFSLTVDEDNKLIITKLDGSSRVITILPDQAVTKLQEKGILVEGETPELTENEAGEAVYKVSKEEERRFLGIALKFKRESEVSAETGEVKTKSGETNPVKRLLERFLF
ncbi:MAG: hypothetical protein DPW11_03425 [bacterium]|nr:hypothetical protein [Candidatus Microgenomates bacterium CPR3]MCQ3944800.1 hypothetical protein [bacterium]RIK51939.1 MAG: hypothetical protein DCC61_00945 [Candidatus Microgenomates bacterium]